MNWRDEEFNEYTSYGLFLSMFGTFAMVGGVAKIFGLAEALMGFISTFFSAVARLIFVSSTLIYFVLIINNNTAIILAGKCRLDPVDVCR